MDQVTRVKKYLKKEQWQKLIKDCQNSGMTVKAWCKANGICEQTYYRNLRKYREEICAVLPVPQNESNGNQPVVFQKVELPVSRVIDGSAAIRLHLCNAVVEIQEGTSPETIQAVLGALQRSC